MQNVIDEFKEISGEGLGRTDKLAVNIETGDSAPFRQYQDPMSPYMQQILNKEVDDMLNQGVIEPSQSPW